MPLVLSLVLLLGLLAPAAHAADRAADRSMVNIEYRFIVVNIKPGSSEGSVGKMWRYKDSYARLEERAVVFPDEPVDTNMCSVLRAKIEDSEIKLFLDKDSKQPRQVWIRNPRSEYAVRYLRYQTDLAADLSRFAVPKDVQVTRAN